LLSIVIDAVFFIVSETDSEQVLSSSEADNSGESGVEKEVGEEGGGIALQETIDVVK
jgi:hypothetical protein